MPRCLEEREKIMASDDEGHGGKEDIQKSAQKKKRRRAAMERRARKMRGRIKSRTVEAEFTKKRK
jgi:hypothetical protein